MHIWGQLPGIHMERVSIVRLKSHYKVVARRVRIETKVMGRVESNALAGRGVSAFMRLDWLIARP